MINNNLETNTKENASNSSRDKVSVIIPAFNAEKTIRRCVDSLLRQTYPAVEIIVVNDGSTDQTLNICSSYKDIIVVDKSNGGVSSARNAGIVRASGEFLMFVDSDDWVEPDYCEIYMKYFEKESLLFSDPTKASKINDNIQRFNRNQALILRGAGIESPVLKLFELPIIKNNHIRFPENISLGEDFVFVLRYLSCISGDIVRLQYSGYHYEIQEGESLSKRIPSCEQTKYFYEQLLAAKKNLKIDDDKSRFIIDRSCMLDFEKLIAFEAKNGTIRFIEKCHIIKKIMSCSAYKKTCYVGVGSQNRLYEMLYKNRRAYLLTAYYSIKW